MNLFSNVTGIVSNISWAADIAGMITSVVLGLLWYSQMVFGKIWMKQNGLNKKNPGTEAQNSMLWHLPIAFIIAANISAFCKHFDYHTGAEWMLIWYDLGLVAILLLAIGYLYEQKTLILYGINAWYIIISMSLMGFFIGVIV